MAVECFRQIFAILKAIEVVAGLQSGHPEGHCGVLLQIMAHSRVQGDVRDFCLVPRHSGILGSETANAFARLGSLFDDYLTVDPNPTICSLRLH